MNPTEADRPLYRRPRLEQVPKLRDLYWCEFPRDARVLEFWKRRPVIVIAGDGTLSSALQVVPCSSQPQGSNRWAYQLATAIDGVGPSWAVCDKASTMAVSRLSFDASQPRPRRLTQEEFTAVLGLVLARLPRLQAPPLAPDLSADGEALRGLDLVMGGKPSQSPLHPRPRKGVRPLARDRRHPHRGLWRFRRWEDRVRTGLPWPLTRGT